LTPHDSFEREADTFEVPERWYPYRHDIWGASHQIMHCLVVCAAFALLFELLRAFEHVHGQGDICAA
jgi:adiponectin receptor